MWLWCTAPYWFMTHYPAVTFSVVRAVLICANVWILWSARARSPSASVSAVCTTLLALELTRSKCKAVGILQETRWFSQRWKLPMLNYLERASDISEAAIEWLRKLSFWAKDVTLGSPSMEDMFPKQSFRGCRGLACFTAVLCVLGCVLAVVVDVGVWPRSFAC